MPKRHFFAPLLLTIFFFSCGNSSQEDETSKPLEELADGKKLAAQMQQILAAHPDWSSGWGAGLNLGAEGFDLVRLDSIQDLTMPERNPILPDDPLYPYQFSHPEGNGRMDLYSSKVEARKDEDTAFLNPDSKAVWYREDGMKETLVFMGPSGLLEDGQWVSAQEFMIMGYFQEENGFRPMIWWVDLEKDLLYQYAYEKAAKEYDGTAYLKKKLAQVQIR